MPTPEQLEDVLKQKQKLIDQAQQRLALYNKEIENAIHQLSEKRSELGVQARQTVKDYDASIARLESNIEQKRKEIIRLDGQIHDKIQQLNEEHEDAKKTFKKLADDLVAEYTAKMAKLEATQKEFESIKAKYNEDHAKLVDDAFKFEATKAHVADKEKLLDIEIDRLFKDREKFLKSLKESQEDFEEKGNAIALQLESVETIRAEQNRRQKVLEELEQKVQGILERENGFDLREAEIQNGIKKNADKESELNTANVRTISENRRLTQKEETLRVRDEELNRRENNLKIAEAQFVDKG